jgi:hypothetical protein
MLDKIKRLGGHVLVYGFGNVENRVVGFLQTVAGMALAILFVVGLREGGRSVLLSQLLAELLLCAYLIPATRRGLTLRFSRRDARDHVAAPAAVGA